MKPIFIFAILVYMLLPVVCFAQPGNCHVPVASDVVDSLTSEYLDKQGMDSRDANCWPAEHALSADSSSDRFPAIRLRESFRTFFRPLVLIPIFVPPQNLL